LLGAGEVADLWVFDGGAGAEGEEDAAVTRAGRRRIARDLIFGYRCCCRRDGRLRDIDADFGMALAYRKVKP